MKPRDKQRKILEKEIAHHAQVLLDKKLHLNTLTDIAVLPPELLAEIFMCARVQEMIKRSKNAELILRVDSRARLTEGIKEVLSQMHRAVELHLYGSADVIVASEELSVKQAPRLVALSFAHISDGDLPQLFTECDMPNLRELTLQRCRIDPSHGVFSRPLEKLVLRQNVSIGILTALRTLQTLKHLELVGTFTLLDPTTVALPQVTDAQRIALPNLSFLRLSGRLIQIAHLWNILVLPSSTVIEFESYPTREPEYNAVAPVIASRMNDHINGTHKTIISTLACWFDNDSNREEGSYGPGSNCLAIDLHTETLPIETVGQRKTRPHLRIAIPPPGPSLLPTRIIDAILPNLPLENVESVFLGDMPLANSAKSSWTKLLEGMPKLTTLRAAGRPADDLYKLLKSRVEDRMAPKKTRRKMQWLMPRLQTLFVEDGLVNVTEPAPPGMRTDHLESLIKILQSRAKSGSGLRHLGLTRCYNLNNEIVESMRSQLNLDELEWDGFEQSWFEDENSDEEDDLGLFGPGWFPFFGPFDSDSDDF